MHLKIYVGNVIIFNMKINRLMISGLSSGCGKTSVTLALIAALKSKGLEIRAFKTGPDYIDTAYHEKNSGNPSYNLDSFFLKGAKLRTFFEIKSQNFDMSVVEGAKGFYDGISNTIKASSYDIANILEIPVILVLNPTGMGLSVAAAIKGFMNFAPKNHIKGVILNKIKPDLYEYYRDLIEKNTGLLVCGYLPEIKNDTIDTHLLGLRTVEENRRFNDIISTLCDVALETFDFRKIASVGASADDFKSRPISAVKPVGEYVLAVAKDGAFRFRYNENIELLEKYGAKIEYFSPLYDSSLPKYTSGIYLCGGFPESYLDRLCSNKNMIRSIHFAASMGCPIYAECGGFVYLHEKIYSKEGKPYKGVSLIPGEAKITDQLQNSGYAEFTSSSDNILFNKGTKVYGYEYHYSVSNSKCDAFTAKRENNSSWDSGVNTDNILAGYAHLYLPSHPDAAEKFSKICLKYSNK